MYRILSRLAHIAVHFTSQVIFLGFLFFVVNIIAVILYCMFRRVSLLPLYTLYMYVYFLLRGDEFPLCFHSGWYLSIVLLLAFLPLLVGTSYIYIYIYICFFFGGGVQAGSAVLTTIPIC